MNDEGVLTEARKTYIDGLDVYQLLQKVRFAPVGDIWMQGEVGKYWINRLEELRLQDGKAYVAASKELGWER